MANILFLAHRLPYPPNKGDKVRSYHLLRHLADGHRVFLGTFIDDPDDERHLPKLRTLCADIHVARIKPRWSRLASLRGLLTGEPLSLPYFRDRALREWVGRTLADEGIAAIVVFSSPMGQYLASDLSIPLLVDFIDVDSAKWTQYAQNHRGPLAWIYGREGRLLLGFERSLAARSTRSFFVTDNEVGLFTALAPECKPRVEAMSNGVDAEFFRPDPALPNPFAANEIPLVFTGAMDYHPNEDGAVWFAREVLPKVQRQFPQARFHVVGRSPTPAVQALASDSVNVTGTVPDVRPYLQHAALVVAPLRIARGIQNKILEAMAMARPVLASAECAGGIDAKVGSEFLVAAGADAFATRIVEALADPQRLPAIGSAGRACVLAQYSWRAHLSRIDRYLVDTAARANPSDVPA